MRISTCALLRISIPAICATLAAAPSAAQHVHPDEIAVQHLSPWFSAEAYVGHLSGKSGEFVYDPASGHKISQLDWRIETKVAGGTISVRPVDWLTFKVGGWLPFHSKNKMNDYDWLMGPSVDWTHWSTHPDTRLHSASMVDARVGARLIATDGLGVSALAGYRRLRFNWTAYGGNFVYSSIPGFRDQVGSFPDGQAGISYEQWFHVPYLGVSAEFNNDRWSVGGELIGSGWTLARDRDHHHLRSLIFEERAKNVPMFGASLSAGYRLTDTLAIIGRLEYQHYFEGKTSSTIYDQTTGVSTHIAGKAAGLDHKSTIVWIGLKAMLP